MYLILNLYHIQLVQDMLHALGHKFECKADAMKQCEILSKRWYNELLPTFLKYGSETGVKVDDDESVASK